MVGNMDVDSSMDVDMGSNGDKDDKDNDENSFVDGNIDVDQPYADFDVLSFLAGKNLLKIAPQDRGYE
jgi:hypothetical protein